MNTNEENLLLLIEQACLALERNFEIKAKVSNTKARPTTTALCLLDFTITFFKKQPDGSETRLAANRFSTALENWGLVTTTYYMRHKEFGWWKTEQQCKTLSKDKQNILRLTHWFYSWLKDHDYI